MPSGTIVGGIATGVSMLLRSRMATPRLSTCSTPTAAKMPIAPLGSGSPISSLRRCVSSGPPPNPSRDRACEGRVLHQLLSKRALRATRARPRPRGHSATARRRLPAVLRRLSPWKQRLIRGALRAPHRLMALSESWARYFRDLASSPSVAIVPNALDTRAYVDTRRIARASASRATASRSCSSGPAIASPTRPKDSRAPGSGGTRTEGRPGALVGRCGRRGGRSGRRRRARRRGHRVVGRRGRR